MKNSKYSKKENEQIINELKAKVKITDYAQSIGFTVVRIGKYYTLKEHDSVRIDLDKNCFWRNSTGANGSVIDFCIEFEKLDLPNAINKLKSYCGLVNTDYTADTKQLHNPHKENNNEQKKFILPQRDTTQKNVFAYLIYTRKIDKDIVSELIKSKNIYQDIHKNCVFVGYDKYKKPCFACKRGTNTFKRFVGDVEGSNYDEGLYFNNNKKSLVICESPIDAMSYMSLLKINGRNYKDYDYLILASATKYDYIKHTIEKKHSLDYYKTITIALDNDDAGKKFTTKIEYLLKNMNYAGSVHSDFPKFKDFNEDLCALADKSYNNVSVESKKNEKNFEMEM